MHASLKKARGQRRVAIVGSRAQKRASGLPALHDRASGLLLHLTSLPGPHGNGDLGEEAHAFAQLLARTGQRWWQMLPIGPAGYGDSPYSAESAFAGNPLLVDLDALGVPIDPSPFPAKGSGNVDYARAHTFRERHLRRAFDAFVERGSRSEQKGLAAFEQKAAYWLDDFALFRALKRAHGNVEWTKWESGARLRDRAALKRARHEHAGEIAFTKFVQWKFDEQWTALRARCAALGIGLIGDLPIFVAHDSADVWSNPSLWKLDEDGAPVVVAGVPPDYFSRTGQRWGNPLYRWAHLGKGGYTWWIERVRAALARFDALRLDHFIGFVRYWQVPGDEDTALNGKWMKGPGRPLFDAVQNAIGALGARLPFIAEDLGAVTASVTRLRCALGLPGMRIVQFAFGDDPQVDLFKPHNHERASVVYTGTHDNDTVVGWFGDPGDGKASSRTKAQTEAERRRALAYLGIEGAASGSGEAAREIHWHMIRLAMSSVASTAIIPVQDVLGLGSEARMNSPGSAGGNWRWRLRAGAIDERIEQRLLEVTQTYGRDEASAQENRS